MLTEKAQADDQGKWYSPYTQTIVDKDGEKLEVDSTPVKPPQVKMEAEELPEPVLGGAASTLTSVPAFYWTYGCSATSAGMLAGYYDQPERGYTNMYAGPTNGGVCPLNNSIWGTTVYPNVTCGECPLVATHQGKDGLAVKGHVDDFWSDYGSSADPYWGAWAQHTYANCTADYMGTNEYHNWHNTDGSTMFVFWTNNSPTYDYTASETGSPALRDGCHGLKLFFESRGYTVTSNYNQRIYGYNNITAGFTYDDFKAQINAGRPVLIQLVGHTMLGYGYSDPNTIAIHDTWDNLDHTMTWGGTYGGMQQKGVTVIELAALAYPLNISSSTGGTVTDPGIGTFGPYDPLQVVNITATANACFHFVNWTGNTSTIANVSSSSTTITMNSSKTIQANFVPNGLVYLNISSGANGNVTAPGTGRKDPYSCGQIVNLTAVADSGYEFVAWSGDTGTIANPTAASTNITMNANYSITANFGSPPTGFYGDANRDGKLSILDYSSVQLMRFGQLPFNPGADANRDGLLNILDYSTVQLMRFGQYPIVNKYEVRYDFTSGNGSNKWAKNSSISAPPPALNKTFETDTGWTNASAAQYNNISSTDGIAWNISGASGKYAAVQCKFTIIGAAANITSIGITLNGSAKTNGDVLQFYAWNFSSGSWNQSGSNFSMTTSIATYSTWTTWGKVYTNYINGSGYIYILANLNNASENLYVDYIKLIVAHP